MRSFLLKRARVKEFGYGRMVAVVVVTLFAVFMLKKSGELDPNKELEQLAQRLAKDFPEPEEPAAPATASEKALAQLRRLLSEGSTVDLRFGQVDALPRDLEDEGLRQLIAEVRPLGVYGYAGWVRCALFAEWGRRDIQSVLAYLENPPPLDVPYRFPYHGWEERQARYSAFRGWSEDSPYVAIGALRTSDHPGAHWKWFAYREAARALAAQDGLRGWNLLPRGSERGGALLGLFEGLSDFATRLEAVNRWMPEFSAAGGRGFDLGGERFFTGTPQGEIRRAEFLTQVGAVLAEADFEGAMTWMTERAAEQDSARALLVDPMVVRYASLHPARAQRALKENSGETEALIRGILRGRPRLAPDLLTSVVPARRLVVLKEVVAVSNGSARRHYFPSPHRANVRLQDGEIYHAMMKAVDAGDLDPVATSSLQQELRRWFRDLLWWQRSQK